MKKILLLSLALCATTGAFPRDHASAAAAQTLCAACGIVQGVHAEKRKGQGGAAGIVGGAVVGGLLGHQIGGGSGRTLATVGGAAAGGYVGNEVQKQVNSTTTWVTTVRMRDGSMRRFEQPARPAWRPGMAVRAGERGLHRM
jgi:outer membrane lipoprotein SlyB